MELSYSAGNMLGNAYLEVRWPQEDGPVVDAAKWMQQYLEEVADYPETDVDSSYTFEHKGCSGKNVPNGNSFGPQHFQGEHDRNKQ